MLGTLTDYGPYEFILIDTLVIVHKQCWYKMSFMSYIFLEILLIIGTKNVLIK